VNKSATASAGRGCKGMSRVRRPLAMALAGLAVLLTGAAGEARAAEGFVAILEDGRLVRLQSDALPGVSTPVRIRGLAPREQLVALGHGGGRLLGIGSSARLYDLDASTGRARRVGAPFLQGLRGQRFSLAVAPDGRSARLLSDVGQDLTIDAITAATFVGSGVRRADGTMAFPAADRAPDGTLIGVDVPRRELLREAPQPPPPPPPATPTAPGTAAPSAAVAARPVPTLMSVKMLDIDKAPAMTEPVAFTIDSANNGWIAAAADFVGSRRRQTALQRVSLETGTATNYPVVLARRLRAFAAVGTVADDRRKPQVTVRVPARISIRRLLASQLPVRLGASEGVVVDTRLTVGGQAVGTGYDSTDTPGRVVFKNFAVGGAAGARERLKASAGRTAQLRFQVRDHANNRTIVLRKVRLER